MSDNLRISTEPSDADVRVIHRFLAEESYWSRDIPYETVRKALAHSLCFVGFVGEELVAFGRVVTDYATYGYLKDIFVLPAHRGRGIGGQLVNAMLARLEHEGVRSLMLATQDAHGLYARFGFELVEETGKLMRRVRR
jgi:GNAT superfamily N-acetyltransferase